MNPKLWVWRLLLLSVCAQRMAASRWPASPGTPSLVACSQDGQQQSVSEVLGPDLAACARLSISLPARGGGSSSQLIFQPWGRREMPSAKPALLLLPSLWLLEAEPYRSLCRAFPGGLWRCLLACQDLSRRRQLLRRLSSLSVLLPSPVVQPTELCFRAREGCLPSRQRLQARSRQSGLGGPALPLVQGRVGSATAVITFTR